MFSLWDCHRNSQNEYVWHWAAGRRLLEDGNETLRVHPGLRAALWKAASRLSSMNLTLIFVM